MNTYPRDYSYLKKAFKVKNSDQHKAEIKQPQRNTDYENRLHKKVNKRGKKTYHLYPKRNKKTNWQIKTRTRGVKYCRKQN